jgi:hypothetical protein
VEYSGRKSIKEGLLQAMLKDKNDSIETLCYCQTFPNEILSIPTVIW